MADKHFGDHIGETIAERVTRYVLTGGTALVAATVLVCTGGAAMILAIAVAQ